MVIRTTSSIVRRMRFTLALAVVSVSLLPEPAAHGQTPRAAVEGSGTKPPAAAEKGARPAATPAVSKEAQAKCENYVNVLGGRAKDAAVAKQPEFRRLAARAHDLVTCIAVRADSDDACNVLDKEYAEDCRRTRATFHEMRAYPQGRSYMFDEAKYEECKQNGGMPRVVCDALRKALRAGDPSQCVMEADFAALCRDAVKAGTLQVVEAGDCGTQGPIIRKMFEGQCRALVNLDEKQCDVPGPHAEGMAEQCRKDIQARKPYGKGLKALAASGAESDRELAKAALDDPDACKASTKSAMDTCLGTSGVPAAQATSRPKGGTEAPDTAAPDAAEAPPQ